jgi:hypothetical protein
MRCAHPDEFVPQWPTAYASVDHPNEKADAVGTPSEASPQTD